MYALIYLTLFLYSNAIAENVTDDANENDCMESTVNDVADQLLDLLGIKEDGKDSDRIKELKERRKKTLNYAYDKENYNILFLQELRDTDLNETNFYKAMHEKDHFQTVSNQSKNLFLKLKERMNRDDIVQILANSRKFSSRKSARRMMGENFIARSHKDKQMEDIVDKIIAEVPHDDHKYDESDRYSKYWDPDRELKDRQEYHQHDGRRIFKGERTNVRWYPFMVSIHVMSRFWCGGSIFWKDMIVTSAACLQLMHNNRFFRENPKVLNVRVGSNHSRVSGEVIPALEVYFHPGYSPKTLKNNIALIRLNKLLCVTHHSVPKMIALHHNPGGVTFTGEVLLLGWGVTKKSQKMAYEPIFLQRKILPIYPNTFCKEIYGNRFISESMFCAGTMTTGEGACDHDAGGPAIMYGKLVGIISFGPTICGYPNTPTVFTLVGAFADWIETVNESMPGYYRNIAYKTTTTTEKTMPTIETRKGIVPFTTPKSNIIFSDSYDSMVSGVSVITVDEGQPLHLATGPVVLLSDPPTTPKPGARESIVLVNDLS